MIKITCFLALSIFVAVATFLGGGSYSSSLVSAACVTNAECDNAQVGTSNQGKCPLSWFQSQFAGGSVSSVTGSIYANCVDDGGSCCRDPCAVYSTTAQCLAVPESANSASPLCIFMPATTTSYQCISKYKLCAVNTYANCNKNPLCEYSNSSATSGTCGLKLQYSAAETQDFSLASCPALHGAVVAFLVLMFISLVGAIIFVIIVVVVKQRKADEEEKKAAEEAAAAEAAAKAQQEEQADF